jgi:hypothetical protein
MPTKDRTDPMYTGPWLDRLFPIYLPDGRMASVTEFFVLPSNVGILEGGLRAEWNARQREKILKYAQERCGEPIAGVEPTIISLDGRPPGTGRERLPWMACVASLTSEPLDPDNTASTLTVVWWQDAFTRPLPEEIERAVAAIDWGKCARDYDFS